MMFSDKLLVRNLELSSDLIASRNRKHGSYVPDQIWLKKVDFLWGSRE